MMKSFMKFFAFGCPCLAREVAITGGGAIVSAESADTFFVVFTGDVAISVFTGNAKAGTRFVIKDVSLSDHAVKISAIGGVLIDGLPSILLDVTGRSFVELEFDGKRLWVIRRG